MKKEYIITVIVGIASGVGSFFAVLALQKMRDGNQNDDFRQRDDVVIFHGTGSRIFPDRRNLKQGQLNHELI